MVGDGVNDARHGDGRRWAWRWAPPERMAMESADVVLMSDDLSKIPYTHCAQPQDAPRCSSANLSFALGMIVIVIVFLNCRCRWRCWGMRGGTQCWCR